MEGLQGGKMPSRKCFERAIGSAEGITLLAGVALAGFDAGCL